MNGSPRSPTWLSITEVSRLAPSQDRDRRSGWVVDVHLGDDLVGQNLTVCDPLAKDEQKHCKWYLEEVLTEESFWVDSQVTQKSQLTAATDHLREYRNRLFEQLKLKDLELKYEKLEINIYEGSEVDQSLPTIHSLWWEQLETMALWPRTVKDVNVRRVIAPRATTASATWSLRGRGLLYINILLVISRTFSEIEAINPSLAEIAILEAQDKLARSDKRHRIKLDIVRPGTYNALQRHLEWRELRSGPCFYHIVHFDVHGMTKRLGHAKGVYGAFLRFMDEDNRERYRDVLADHVAILLKDHHVACAIINACQSAKSDQGLNANLSQIFISKGISNVLGMSFNFTASAARLFNEALYMKLLHDEQPFSKAVHAARTALRRDRIRNGLGGPIKIEDWFIPVAYIRGVDKGIRTSLTELSVRGATRVPSSSFLDKVTNAVRLFCSCFMQCLVFISYAPGLHVPPIRHVSLFGETDSLSEVKLLAGGIVELNMAILELEIYMVEKRVIYYNGLPGAGKTDSILRLCHYWIITGFIDHAIYINSNHFQENWANDVVRSIRGEPSPNKIFQLHRPPCSRDDDFRLWAPRILIVMDHVDDVFKASGPTHAQERFHNLLSKIKQKFPWPKDRDEAVLPYLILIGQKEAKWWTAEFAKVDTGPGTPIAATPVVVHGKR